MLFGNNPNYDPKPAPPLGGYGDLSTHNYDTRAHSTQLNNVRKRKEAENQQYEKDLAAWKQRNPGKNGGSRKRRNGTKRRAARKGKRSNRNKK
jgi:hypothetical protein